MKGVVECDAFANLTGLEEAKLTVFGIGSIPDAEKISKLESFKYFLYPRASDKKNYMNSAVPSNGSFIELFLYYNETSSLSGIRISNLKCYKKLVNFFTKSTYNHLVKLKTALYIPQPQVSLLGQVLFVEKLNKKRWYAWPYGNYYHDFDFDFDWD